MQFVIENWQFFVALLCGLVELILLLIFKRRPKIIDTSFFAELVEWIYLAEKRYKVGEDKMAFVLEKAKERLQDHFSEKEVRDLVEFILELPQKKEKINEK